MADHWLILHPVDARRANTEISLKDYLMKSGFIENGFDFWDGSGYKAGSNFITLMKIPPDENEDTLKYLKNQVVISIPEITEKPEYLGSVDMPTAECPFCHYKQDDSVSIICTWYENKDTYTQYCPNCGNTFSFYDIDWKKTAGFGRQHIKILHIHPGEAFPSEELLHLLKQATEIDWTYFFYRF